MVKVRRPPALVPLLLAIAAVAVLVVSVSLSPAVRAPKQPGAADPAVGSAGPSTTARASPGKDGGATSESTDYVAAASGVGDPYFPGAGNAGYDVVRYSIDVAWQRPDVLSGVTTLDAIATQDLSALYVDIRLPVLSVRVNGADAVFVQDHTPDVLIKTGNVRRGQRLMIDVRYAGDPADVCTREQVVSNGPDWVILGEPEGSACWFASNDHPSDPAMYDIRIRPPDGLQAMSAGTLVSSAQGVWRFRVDHAVPTYSVFVAVGGFEVEEGSGGTYLSAVSELVHDRRQVFDELRASPRAVGVLEGFLGPYPGVAVGGFVPSTPLWFAALETSGRPVYQADSVRRSIIVHELAHMWFGNQVTLSTWQDIFNNEAMASYAQWVYDERIGSLSAQRRFDEVLASRDTDPGFWLASMSDPGADKMFGLVYVRGPMAMHALRNVMGDTSFFAMWREWAQQSGPHSVADFRAHAQHHHGASLEAFFNAWIDGTTVMPRTPEFGFGR